MTAFIEAEILAVARRANPDAVIVQHEQIGDTVLAVIDAAFDHYATKLRANPSGWADFDALPSDWSAGCASGGLA